MLFDVDTTSAIPIYAQIITQVKHGIAAGMLCAGDALPSQRELAARLRVNPLTVARAYRELEREGLVVSGQGRGTFIADTIVANEDYRRNALLQAVDKLLIEAHQLSATPAELHALIDERLQPQTQTIPPGALAPPLLGERGSGG